MAVAAGRRRPSAGAVSPAARYLTMVRPARLRLSRRRDFHLQSFSRQLNGLAALNVTRPSRWGNPFVPGKLPGGAAEAVARFREHVWGDAGYRAAARVTLKGHNLACWCPPGQPCHADVLLEIA